MEIKHLENGAKGAFYVEENGVKLAEMTYVWAGKERIIIDHTEVDASLKGKGIGKQLVAQSVVFAREKNIKIIPLCPFAKSVFDRVTDFREVL